VNGAVSGPPLARQLADLDVGSVEDLAVAAREHALEAAWTVEDHTAGHAAGAIVTALNGLTLAVLAVAARHTAKEGDQ